MQRKRESKTSHDIEEYWKPEKIVSGGQTGVDRAGLDAAIKGGIPIGGFCPKGRRAEDGTIPEKYCLTETNQRNYKIRTVLNVQESDGTLILNKGTLIGGTLLTANLAKKHKKHLLIIQLEEPDISELTQWGFQNNIKVLNIAGPRESKFSEGIYQQSVNFLYRLFGEAT